MENLKETNLHGYKGILQYLWEFIIYLYPSKLAVYPKMSYNQDYMIVFKWPILTSNLIKMTCEFIRVYKTSVDFLKIYLWALSGLRGSEWPNGDDIFD